MRTRYLGVSSSPDEGRNGHRRSGEAADRSDDAHPQNPESAIHLRAKLVQLRTKLMQLRAKLRTKLAELQTEDVARDEWARGFLHDLHDTPGGLLVDTRATQLADCVVRVERGSRHREPPLPWAASNPSKHIVARTCQSEMAVARPPAPAPPQWYRDLRCQTLLPTQTRPDARCARTEAEALDAWRTLQRAAAEQGERMREQAPPADEWGAMADIFAPGPDAYPAPELPLLEALTEPQDHWLEVGAGAGRLAIPLARRVRRMSALDRSPGMTARLREEAAASGLDNFEVLPATGWPPPGAPGEAAPIVDVALTASVLFFIEEIGGFLDALEGHARRLCVVVLMDRMPGTPLEALWSGLYDEPAAELPALREFLAVLGARGRAFELRATPPPPEPPLSLDEGDRLEPPPLLRRPRIGARGAHARAACGSATPAPTAAWRCRSRSARLPWSAGRRLHPDAFAPALCASPPMRHDARVTQTRERPGTPQNPIPVDEAVAGGERRFRTFESFSIVSFRWFFSSMFVGFASVGVQMFVSGWLAFELTGSFAALGVLHLVGGISSLLASVPAGVLADKIRHRKRFIQMGQAAGALASLAMGLLVTSGNLQFWQVAAGAAMISAAHSLTMPTRQAVTPSVVGMKHLTNAMALYTTGQNASFLLMPALAGWMIGALGPAGSIEGTQYVYYLMAAFYVGALLLLIPVEIGPRAAAAPARAIGQLADGLRYVWRDPVMRPLLVYNASVALFWMTYMTLLPGYAKEVLGAGASALGVMLSMGGLGAVAGSLIVASIPARQRGRVWILSVTLIGAAMLVFCAEHGLLGRPRVRGVYRPRAGGLPRTRQRAAAGLRGGRVPGARAQRVPDAVRADVARYALRQPRRERDRTAARRRPRRPGAARDHRRPVHRTHADQPPALTAGEDRTMSQAPENAGASERQPYDLTIAEAAAALRGGSLSALALTESVLARIEETEPALNAYMLVTADLAREQAARADEELANGLDRGPLHGIPFALKDLFDTAGITTTGGSDFLRDRVPEEDAFVVAKLYEAGIALTGKLGLHEFAFGTTSDNAHFGAIRNPWNPDHSPGGSSGGSGAATAAGSALGTLGSDTGGSIRIPAAACGVAGLKPTRGLVSRSGVVPLSSTLDHAGPLSKTVEDSALILNAIAGYDPTDAQSLERPPEDFARELGRDLGGLRLGVPRHPLWENCDDEVAAACEAALEELRGLGCETVEVEFPQFATAGRLLISQVEGAAFHEPWLREHPERYSDELRGKIEPGLERRRSTTCAIWRCATSSSARRSPSSGQSICWSRRPSRARRRRSPRATPDRASRATRGRTTSAACRRSACPAASTARGCRSA